MTTNSITERIGQNRLFVDDWSVYEKLLLASAVLKSGDQNWGSVSKMILNLLKSEKFVEKRRPSDWFTPKACNTQYQLLIETYAKDLPRRKKRDKNVAETTETPVEFIVKQLWTLRMDEIDKFSKLKFKETEELEKLIRDVHHGRLSQQEIEAHYDRLEARLINEEKQVILEYEEMMRAREEKRKLIESKTSPFPGSVNTSLVYSSAGEDKSSSSPTSPLLTSLLQSPSRSSTPIMSNLLINPTLSKLLETPSTPPATTPMPANSLLQKELSKPAPQNPQMQTAQPVVNTPSLVPLPTPSPNSIAALEEIKASLPDLAGVVSGDKSGEEGEDFDEKWFDPDFLNMGKEELEGTLNARALLEVLGAAGEEVGIIPGRNDSVDTDIVQEEVISLDLDGPLVEEEVVLEDHIIQSVEQAMETAASQSIAVSEIKTEPTLPPSETPSISIESKPQQETVLDSAQPEVRQEDKEVKAVASEEEKVKPPATSIESEELSVPATETANTKPPPSPTPIAFDSTACSKSKPAESKDRKSSTDSLAPPVKETRSLRASRELEKTDIRADREEKPTRSGSVEPRERRRSRLAEDPSPVRERKTNQESGGGSTLPPPSPVKETRSARLLAREESLSSPGKELRSLRSLESSSPGKELRTRGARESRESEAASPVPRSPRNSKELESSPLKETRSKSRDEPPGKLKESPVKEISKKDASRKQSESPSTSTRKSPELSIKSQQESGSKSSDNLKSAEKSLDSTKSVDTPSKPLEASPGERRRLRSEPEFPLHLHESEDSSEELDESSSEMLEEMKRDFSKWRGAASPTSDVQDEFKTPLTGGKGRKRKHGEGRASPFLSDKTDKESRDPRAKKTLLSMYQTVLTYKHASVFMKPVLDAQANNYSSIVRIQANLSSIKKRIESGAIRTVVQFQRAILLVFTNAMMYNNVNDALYKLAKETMVECNKDLQILVKAVSESGGVEYNLSGPGLEASSLDSPGSPYTTERSKRASAPSPSPLTNRKSRRGEEEEEGEEIGRRGMKRPAAPSPSPRPVPGKKRRTK